MILTGPLRKNSLELIELSSVNKIIFSYTLEHSFVYRLHNYLFCLINSLKISFHPYRIIITEHSFKFKLGALYNLCH